ncbi:hypothetical protein V1293_002478 [Bradyrhizobium sp. AZCC 1693]
MEAALRRPFSCVVPAKAGIHSHRPWGSHEVLADVAIREAAEYGSLLSQGRRDT